jgi:uncharacterized membrane protein YoaK (UPF0700 family)
LQTQKDFHSLTEENLRIWFLLAFQAGAINAGGFIAAGRFVTHTTGFATHFAVDLAWGDWRKALGMLAVPIFFVIGAMFTSVFVDLRLARGRPPKHRWPVLAIFLCLFLAMVLGESGTFGVFGEQFNLKRDFVFMVLLCLASGLQNALITNARGIVVRSTHLTGVTTDLAVSLARIIFGRDLDPDTLEKDRLASLARLGLILSFILGSAASAYLFIAAKYLGFLLPVFTSAVLLTCFWRESSKE